MRFKSLLTILFIGYLFRLAYAEGVMQVPTAIQISSTVSDGRYSIAEIVDIAKKMGIKVIVLGDSFLSYWEYGILPLRRLIRKTLQANSILKYGIERYLDEVQRVQRQNPEIIILPGAETAPFYYWKGSPFKNDFTLCDWHKHILVIGLEAPKDYKELPVIGNTSALFLPFSFKDLFNLWPFLALILGIFLIKKRCFNYRDSLGRKLGPYAKNYQISGIIFIILGLVFLINNYPFLRTRFDPYHGEQGSLPYQHLIDYVNQKGGLTFWAHPEEKNIKRFIEASIQTPEHSELLLKTQDYTGFGIFYAGYEKVGQAGGIWDTVLKQYCQAKRKNPVWAIGALGFDSVGDLNDYLKDLRNILLLPVLNKKEVLEALKRGRVYVIRGKNSEKFILDDFSIEDNLSGIKKIMGEVLEVSDKFKIKIKGHLLTGESNLFKVRLIRDGLIIKDFLVNSPFEITYIDTLNNSERMSYYRIEIESEGLHLVANPIFVRAKDK
ncbi:MAG: hypothetical protein NC912_00105 [Candidatus Omnitrophica bacterium]|nr:hypothetical protein [Candidatus Omnitrophota bacterium]